MFEISEKILKEMELYLIGEMAPNYGVLSNFLYAMKSIFYYPIKLLKVGLDNGLFKDAAKFAFISFVTMLLIGFLFDGVSSEIKEIFHQSLLFPIAVIFPLVVTLFPVPSRLAKQNVKLQHVDFAKNLIKKGVCDSRESIEIFKENMNIFEQRILRRITILRGGLALAWASWVYGSTLFLESSPGMAWGQLLSLSNIIALYAFIVLAYFLLIDSYRKINAIIFRGIEFAANEYSYELINKNQGVDQ